MKIDFTARRVKLHPQVREVVERKLAKLERVLPRHAQAHVIVEAGKKDISIEVSVAGKNRKWLAVAAGPDQPAAAHAVMERIAAQAKKTKAKAKEKKKRMAPASRWPEPGAEPRRLAGPHREPVSTRAMFEEDALTAFSGSTREVLVFRDLGASDAFRVLYRRRDGGFGLLIPD